MQSLLALVDTRLALWTGVASVVAGLAWLFVRRGWRSDGGAPPRAATGRRALVTLALVVAAGAWLRLDGLDRKSLNHTEVYVPGIALPGGVSAPPPRLSLARTIAWHWHVEPHPQGYYFLMWPWTKLVGTSVFALRLPSVLFGVGSILLVHRLAALAGGRAAGLLAAAMLALNGLQIFWSQMARMYAMTCFLGLLSTLLLVRLAAAGRRRPAAEVAYVATTFLGVFTEILFWPLLAAQMLWTAVALRRDDHRPDRLLRLQAVVTMLGAPLWAHAVYRGRPIDLDSPRFDFLREYLSFGFLLLPDKFAVQPTALPTSLALALLALALLCMAAARSGTATLPAPGDGGTRTSWPELLVAGGSGLVTFALAQLAGRRQAAMAYTALVPLVALALPSTLAASVGRFAASPRGAIVRRLLPRHALGVCATMAFVPPALVYLVALRFPLLQTRLFLLYTPYVLTVAAVGALRLASTRWRAVALGVLLGGAHLASVVHFRAALSTPRDYQALAADIERNFRVGDLVFAQHKSWRTTPLFYYLERSRAGLVTQRFEQRLQDGPTGRVFLVEFDGEPPGQRMTAALRGWRRVASFERTRGRVSVYSP